VATEKERNLSPDEVLTMLANWIKGKFSPPGARLSLPLDEAMLRDLRSALQRSTTPVGAAPSPQPDPATTVRSAARSTEIIGHMMDTMSDKYAAMKSPAAFFVKMGRIVWALVEAAIPRSVANLLMRYWFTLLLIVEIVMILASTFISEEKTVQALGVKLLILTLLARAAIELLRLALGKGRLPRLALGAVVVVVLLVLWRGVVCLEDHDWPWLKDQFIAAKQNQVCAVLRCENPKPPDKH
jgi:hypothetical protein